MKISLWAVEVPQDLLEASLCTEGRRKQCCEQEICLGFLNKRCFGNEILVEHLDEARLVFKKCQNWILVGGE